MRETEVVKRLETRLGLGDNPIARRRLYRRLARLAQVHGEPCLRLLAELVQDAEHRTDPGRWFSRAAKLRLMESGFWSDNPPISAASIMRGTDLPQPPPRRRQEAGPSTFGGEQ